jgi:hypothetical protein
MLLGVGGIPVVILGVWDPASVAVGASEGNDQVDTRVLLVFVRFSELDQDRPLADLARRFWVLLADTPDYMGSHVMDDVIGRNVVAIRSQLGIRAAIEDDAAIGVGDGLVDSPVRDAARVERLQRAGEAAGAALDEVPSRLRL